MPQEHINLGTPPSGVDGDTDRQAWVKAEDNFNELYGILGTGDGSIVAQVGENTADIAALEPAVAQNTSDLATYKPLVDANTAGVAANTADLAAYKPKVDANTAALANVNFMGGFKNRLINGTFDWWQRGASLAAYQQASKFLADRWFTTAGFATIDVSRQTFALGTQNVPDGPYYWHRCNVVTAGNAGEYALMGQRIENLSMYSSKQMTISFWAKADANKKMGFELQHSYGSGGSATNDGAVTASFNLTAAWQKFTLTFNTIDMGGKVIGPGAALIINFWFTSGTTYASRASVPMQSGTFDIAQVQLEFGANATPFENRPYGVELAMCQRYCQRMSAGGAYSTFGTGIYGSATAANIPTPTPTSLRTNPTVTKFGNFAVLTNSGATNVVTSVVSGGFYNNLILLQATTAGVVSGQPAQLYSNNDATAYLLFESEL